MEEKIKQPFLIIHSEANLETFQTEKWQNIDSATALQI